MNRLVAVSLLFFGCVALVPAQTPRLVRDVTPGALPSPTAPRVLAPGARQGEVLLALDDGVHGMELWRSDGTAAGTSLVVDLTPGPASTTFFGTSWLPGVVWFVTGGTTGDTLWRTDGTAAGTTQVFSSPLGEVTCPQGGGLGDVLFFTTATSLARTTVAGTPGSTFLLSAPPAGLTAVRGGVAALLGFNGELVVSDGNTAGVVGANVHFRDYGPGRLMAVETLQAGSTTQTRLTMVEVAGHPSVTLQGFTGPIEFGSTFLLVDSAANALLAWDGSGPPVTLATSQSGIGQIQILPGRVVFVAEDATHGSEPWFTDGTPGGTGVLDLTTGAASTTLMMVGGLGNRALWWVTTATHGSEPWVSDGTLAGTTLLRDLEPGPGSSTIDPFFLFTGAFASTGQRRQVLPIVTSLDGRELWITDGTTAGTQLLGDLLPGAGSSLGADPWFPAAAGNTLVWFADDGVHGVEPWAIDLEGIAAPLSYSSTRAFAMDDPVLGTNWALRCSALAPGDLGLVAIGLPLLVPTSLGAGQWQFFDATAVFHPLGIVPNANGEWTGNLALPNAPSLVGLDLVVQALFAPSLQPGGVDFGSAWWITLGF